MNNDTNQNKTQGETDQTQTKLHTSKIMNIIRQNRAMGTRPKDPGTITQTEQQTIQENPISSVANRSDKRPENSFSSPQGQHIDTPNQFDPPIPEPEVDTFSGFTNRTQQSEHMGTLFMTLEPQAAMQRLKHYPIATLPTLFDQLSMDIENDFLQINRLSEIFNLWLEEEHERLKLQDSIIHSIQGMQQDRTPMFEVITADMAAQVLTGTPPKDLPMHLTHIMQRIEQQNERSKGNRESHLHLIMYIWLEKYDLQNNLDNIFRYLTEDIAAYILSIMTDSTRASSLLHSYPEQKIPALLEHIANKMTRKNNRKNKIHNIVHNWAKNNSEKIRKIFMYTATEKQAILILDLINDSNQAAQLLHVYPENRMPVLLDNILYQMISGNGETFQYYQQAIAVWAKNNKKVNGIFAGISTEQHATTFLELINDSNQAAQLLHAYPENRMPALLDNITATFSKAPDLFKHHFRNIIQTWAQNYSEDFYTYFQSIASEKTVVRILYLIDNPQKAGAMCNNYPEYKMPALLNDIVEHAIINKDLAQYFALFLPSWAKKRGNVFSLVRPLIENQTAKEIFILERKIATIIQLIKHDQTTLQLLESYPQERIPILLDQIGAQIIETPQNQMYLQHAMHDWATRHKAILAPMLQKVKEGIHVAIFLGYINNPQITTQIFHSYTYEQRKMRETLNYISTRFTKESPEASNNFHPALIQWVEGIQLQRQTEINMALTREQIIGSFIENLRDDKSIINLLDIIYNHETDEGIARTAKVLKQFTGKKALNILLETRLTTAVEIMRHFDVQYTASMLNTLETAPIQSNEDHRLQLIYIIIQLLEIDIHNPAQITPNGHKLLQSIYTMHNVASDRIIRDINDEADNNPDIQLHCQYLIKALPPQTFRDLVIDNPVFTYEGNANVPDIQSNLRDIMERAEQLLDFARHGTGYSLSLFGSYSLAELAENPMATCIEKEEYRLKSWINTLKNTAGYSIGEKIGEIKRSIRELRKNLSALQHQGAFTEEKWENLLDALELCFGRIDILEAWIPEKLKQSIVEQDTLTKLQNITQTPQELMAFESYIIDQYRDIYQKEEENINNLGERLTVTGESTDHQQNQAESIARELNILEKRHSEINGFRHFIELYKPQNNQMGENRPDDHSIETAFLATMNKMFPDRELYEHIFGHMDEIQAELHGKQRKTISYILQRQRNISNESGIGEYLRYKLSIDNHSLIKQYMQSFHDKYEQNWHILTDKLWMKLYTISKKASM